MTKNAQKRKDNTSATIRRRLSAAICMVLISTIMLVTSTYAWFTLSTAPEVKGINTSVTGNGSLEIALMPTAGTFTGITSGRGASGTEYGGAREMTVANVSWGNVVNLKDTSYGLELITLRPVQFMYGLRDVTEIVYETDPQTGEVATDEHGDPIPKEDPANPGQALTRVIGKEIDGSIAENPFKRPVYGYDGRIASLEDAALKAHGDSARFDADTYGVRAIVDENGDTYGYVIDLAFRLNTVASADENGSTPGKLLLQTTGIQRVYTDSTADATQGGGSVLWFQDKDGNAVEGANQAIASKYLEAIRIAFVQNFGNADNVGGRLLLGFARADVNTGELYICDYQGNPLAEGEAPVILNAMNKNQAYQISVVVWLDGTAVTNANMAISRDVLNTATLNLQFATDAVLVPAANSDLKNNPPAPEQQTPETPTASTTKADLQTALNNNTALYTQATNANSETQANTDVAAFMSKYAEINSGLEGNTYDETSSNDLATLIEDLNAKAEAADAVLNPTP